MDNDNMIKKQLVRLYRNTRLKLDYAGKGLLTEAQGNEYIKRFVNGDTPFLLGRFGAVEMHCVSRWMLGQNCTEEERNQALYAAGIFPNDQRTIDRFCEVYSEAIKCVDILGVWEVTGEKKAINQFCPQAKLIPSRSIEPYYYDAPWSAALDRKKVLIVHPFIESIAGQLQRRGQIWPGKDVLPRFQSVSYVRAAQSNAGAKTGFADWFEALESMKCEISQADFDIAIIGAGAYGLPLSAYIKSLRKQAVQMSGATQILFGIKGKRWDEHPVISKFYNDAWVRPLQSETPPETKKVEGGSYW